MKSNAQLRHESQGEFPQPPPVPVDPTAAASSSQTVPHTFQIKVAFTQLMSAIRSLQQEVRIIGERVKQCQIDIQGGLSYHHPKHDDDED
jgi:hypothetical protein